MAAICHYIHARQENKRSTTSLWHALETWIMTAKSLQWCPTLCDPTDGSPPGSPVPGILQARTLEWLAISFYNAWKWKVKVKSLRLCTWKLYSSVRLLATPWTAVYQAPPSMGFSRQEYWSRVPLPSPWIMTIPCKFLLIPFKHRKLLKDLNVTITSLSRTH